MRKFFILAVFALTLLGCKKETDTSICFTIKYVDGMCNTNVYEIITPEFQHLGQDNWTRQSDGQVYNNVFTLNNYCENINTNNNTNDTLKVRLLKQGESTNTNCFVCLAVYNNPPNKNLSLKACE